MKAPKQPDPVATANAQTTQNINTATAQQLMNMVSQYGPNGSKVYQQTGTGKVNGQDVPMFSEYTTLSPEQQKLYNLDNQTQTNLGNLAVQQSAKLGDYLNSPFDGNQAAEDRYVDLSKKRLDPQWAAAAQQNEQDLMNRGIRPGSELYDRMTANFQQGKNDAYNSMYLNGQNQFFQQGMAARNQPINEITALMSGSQVSQPQFGNAPQVGLQAPNVAGMAYQNYQNKSNTYKGAMGGLFGTGANLASAFLL